MEWVDAGEVMPTKDDADYDGDVVVRWGSGGRYRISVKHYKAVMLGEFWLRGANK